MSKYRLYINDISRAIKDIESSTKNKTDKSFAKDKNLIDATAMRLQIIGESIKKLPDNFKKKEEGINWEYLEGLRNIISHAYFRISSELLFDVVKTEIPKLKKAIKKLK